MFGYWPRLFLSLSLFIASPLLSAETDPPGRVGRISLADEGLQLRIGDSAASGSAALNWPLTTGALIETASESRGEARIGSTTLRIGGGTSLEFVELSDERIWLRLSHGSVILNIQNPEHAAEMALDAPEGRLRADAPGIYRADVMGGTTAFSTYRGMARIGDLGLTIRAGDRILLMGGTDRNYLLGQAVNDAFRQWSLSREQADAGGGTRYVSPEMTGYEALDRHGHWRETSDYGPAWFPQGMPPGWAPYRWGRWAWISPWGWTWIDHAPWGFAPFHYGRWTLIGGQWAWLPGAYAVRPVYAPALVVWLGQPGWNVSFTFGTAPAVGWFPLGPREIYYPYYRSTLRHVRSINATHVIDVNRIVTVTPPPGDRHRHMHRDRHEALTVVPHKTLTSGIPVNNSAVLKDRDVHSSAPIASSPPAVQIHERGSRASATPSQAKSALPEGTSPSAARPMDIERRRDVRHLRLPSQNEPAPVSPAPSRFAVELPPPSPKRHAGASEEQRGEHSRPEPLQRNHGSDKAREPGHRDQPRQKRFSQEH